MTAYILKRILLMIPTLLGVMVVTFTITQFVPGGPVEKMIGEIWGAMPELYLLIFFASIFKPSILLLLFLLSLFSWMGLSDYVRAEFLRGRNLEYVNAARALGVGI